eukprot:scaffold3455_cov213-Prasinococcus_capsulatus_cf.AAC.2
MSEPAKGDAEREKQMNLLNVLVPEAAKEEEQAPQPVEPEVTEEEPKKAPEEPSPGFFFREQQPSGEPKRTPVGEESYNASFGDRVISSLAYTLPLLDSLRYSKFLLMQFPVLSLALAPLLPVSKLYFSLGTTQRTAFRRPAGGFISQLLFFFGLYFGVGRNSELSPYVRFNAMQAVVLDILLILPDVLSGLVRSTTGGSTEVEILYNNFVFLYVYANAVYACFYTVQGKKPRLPLVADAADFQVR